MCRHQSVGLPEPGSGLHTQLYWRPGNRSLIPGGSSSGHCHHSHHPAARGPTWDRGLCHPRPVWLHQKEGIIKRVSWRPYEFKCVECVAIIVLSLFPIRPCVYSCWPPWEPWLARLAPYWPKAWAPRRLPGSCHSRPGGLFTSPRWRCSRSCWRAAPVSASPCWRSWRCCSEWAWWCWSQSTSETQQRRLLAEWDRKGRTRETDREKVTKVEKALLSRNQVDCFCQGVFSCVWFRTKRHPLMAYRWILLSCVSLFFSSSRSHPVFFFTVSFWEEKNLCRENRSAVETESWEETGGNVCVARWGPSSGQEVESVCPSAPNITRHFGYVDHRQWDCSFNSLQKWLNVNSFHSQNNENISVI